jgi:hypothetical protein
MGVPRRTVLTGVAVTFAGCSGVTTGGDPATDSQSGGADAATVTDSATTTPQTTPESATCDPTSVTRPPVPTDTTVEGQSYPAVPAAPTTESVTAFLTEFETAFAWNRAVGEFPDATGVRVQTLDGFEPESTDEGFRATARMRVFVVIDESDGVQRVEREDHLVGYAVAEDGVYRAETAERGTDPRESPDRQLVACGADSEN